MNTRLLLPALAALALLPARALEINYANKGADGAFAPSGQTHVVDLSLAVTGKWDAATPANDHGIYDPEKWAVVFKFSALNIPAGTTVTFKNHPSRAPVVWLVDGDVEIAGTVNLDGEPGDRDASRLILAEPGPGGFRGGDYPIPGASMVSGLGPGGSYGNPGAGGAAFGYQGNQGASYGTVGGLGWGATAFVPFYGNAQVIPLIGGSGHGPDGNAPTSGGGAGGGAILIAAREKVILGDSGIIHANGTSSGVGGGANGTGGAIRIVCENLRGGGALKVLSGNYSGAGRIRIECVNYQANFAIHPPTFPVLPATPVRLWPEDAAPRVRIVSVAEVNAPADPRANLAAGQPADMVITPGVVTKLVTIETANMPTNATVTLRVVSTPSGGDVRVNADFLSTTADPAKLRWQKEVTFQPGYHALQVVAVSP